MGRLFYLPDEDNLRIFCMYTKNKGVVAATPPGTKHISHATYLNESAANLDNRSNIDHFLVNSDANEEEIFGKDIQILHGKRLHPSIRGPEVEKTYGVQIQVMDKFRELTPVIKRITITDIHDFMLDKKDPKVKSGYSLEYVDNISSKAELHFAGLAQIDTEGKQTFYPNCILDINLDVAKWCPSGISPDGKIMPRGACAYCYSSFKHTGYPNVFKVEKNDLIEQIQKARVKRAKKGLPTRYLRLGKQTEFGFHAFREQLVNTLEACLEEEIGIVFPTKYLKFDKEIADLLKRTASTLLPSLGDDKFELGAVMHGCTNDWRFEQGIWFREAGVRVIPYILVNPLEKDGGENFGRNLKRAEKDFGRYQILPIVTKDVKVAEKVLGGTYDLVGHQHENLFGESTGGYEISTGRRGVPTHIHPSLEKRVGDNNGNIRICLHNSCVSSCGKCFLPKEKGEIIPAEKVNLKKTSRWRTNRQRYQGKGIPGGELFDMNHKDIKREKPEN